MSSFTSTISAKDSFASFVKEMLMKKSIVVLAGAGISVSCGIQDFRSRDGLYNTLNYQELGLASPEDLFDIETFKEDPRPFFRFAKTLYPGNIDPSPCHNFLAWLNQNNKLLRVYTQNIDGLEEKAGVDRGKVVYAHGSLLSATCLKCNARYKAADIAADVKEGRVPLCQRVKEKNTKEVSVNPQQQQQHSRPLRKRSFIQYSEEGFSSVVKDATNDGVCGGVVKPDITFFGEKLGSGVGLSLQKDWSKADALIVMGTSLSVAPMSKVVDFLPPNVYRVLINRNIIHPPNGNEAFKFDMCLLGNCDDVVEALKQQMTNEYSKSTCNYPLNVILADQDASWLKNQSPENVLLFKGAITTQCVPDQSSIQKLVVFCDGCKDEILGDIHVCQTCFDYDLCSTCFPEYSNSHADGTHKFAIEDPK